MKWKLPWEYFSFEGFPTFCGPNKTSVTVDLFEVFILFFFVLVGMAYLIILPGYRREKRFYNFIKVSVSLVIGCLLMLSIYGQQWEVGKIKSRMPYRAGEKTHIKAFIGINIGLHSMNVTLKGIDKQKGPLVNEIINYNERFSWTWDQGRSGFGPNAGPLQKSFREAQSRGLPIPIIWVVEYFIIDGGDIRFGRFYRTAGWYCNLLLWSAVPAWLLANLYLQSVGRYAAYFIGTVGLLEILSCLVWIFVRNPLSLAIPFEDKTIKLSFGIHFWMTVTGGIISLLSFLLLIIMDLRFPNLLSTFLGINILDQYDECVIRANELDYIKNKSNKDESIELGKMSEHLPDKDSVVVLFKRRSTAKIAQKNFFRLSMVPVKIPDYDDITVSHQGPVIPKKKRY